MQLSLPFVQELGIQPGNETPMGIQSVNCVQRLAAEIGCFINNMVAIPFHRTFTEEWHQVEIGNSKEIKYRTGGSVYAGNEGW